MRECPLSRNARHKVVENFSVMYHLLLSYELLTVSEQ